MLPAVACCIFVVAWQLCEKYRRRPNTPSSFCLPRGHLITGSRCRIHLSLSYVHLQMQLADRYLRESNKTVNSESSTIKINSQKNVEKEKLTQRTSLRFHSRPLMNLSSAAQPYYALIAVLACLIDDSPCLVIIRHDSLTIQNF